MRDYLLEAIKLLRPNAEFSYNDNDYSTIKWDVLEGNAPTKKEIDDAIKQIKVEDDLKKQKREEILERLGLSVDELKLLLG
jgi:hypothetical protein